MRKTLILAPLALIGSFLLTTQSYAADICSCNLYRNGICYDMVCRASGSTSSSSTSTSKKNLTLSIADDRDPARVGDTITYTITIKNKSSQKVKTDVVATLDDGMRFVSASNDADDQSDEVTWQDVSISAGKTKTLTLKVRLASSVRSGDTVTLRVSAGGQKDDEDTEVEDGVVCRGLYCDSSNGNYTGDVQVTVTDDRSTVRPDDIIRYTIDLRNHSSSSRTVDLQAYLDSNTTFIAASDGGYLYNSNRVQWNNFRVYGDDRETVTVDVRVRSNVSYGTTLYFRAETPDARDSQTTRVDSSSSSSSSNDTCTYYNSYTRQNYTDYCDDRHERPRR